MSASRDEKSRRRPRFRSLHLPCLDLASAGVSLMLGCPFRRTRSLRAHTFNVRSCPDHASDASQTMAALTNVYNDHPKAVLFATAAALRVLLALTFSGLPDLLTGRVEISTPVNSFKRCTWHTQVDRWPQWLRYGQELRQRSAGRLVPI